MLLYIRIKFKEMQKQFIHKSIMISFNEPKGYLGYFDYALEKFEETEYIHREMEIDF